MVQKENNDNERKTSNCLINAFKRIKESIEFRNNKKEMNYNDYVIKFDRLTFIVLIGYVIVTSISIFIINSFLNGENAFIFFCSLIVMIICFIISALHLFWKSDEKTMKIFYYFLVVIMDVLFFSLAYYSFYILQNRHLYSKYIYFFMLSIIIFAILKFNSSYVQILIYLGYKTIIFSVVITFKLPVTDEDNKVSTDFDETLCNCDLNSYSYPNFTIEIICFCLMCICVFLFTIIKQDFTSRSMEFYTNNKFAIEYFQSLINTLNKAFLSFNLTKYTINTNKSMINLMKALGVSEEIIYENLFEKNNSQQKPDKNPSLLTLRSLRRSRLSQRLDNLKNSNINSSDRHILKNSRLFYEKSDNINGFKITTDIQKNTNNNINDFLKNDNNELKNKFRYDNLKNGEINNKQADLQSLKLNENTNYDLENIEHKLNKSFDLSNVPQCEDEGTFLNKLDFLLNSIFSSFREEGFQRASLKRTNFEQEKLSLSQALKEIFFSREKISNDQNFIFKGVYESREKKIVKENKQINMIIEVYYRKIKTINGELVEFFFNDITLTRDVEMEKAENKVKAMVLAKISHEFKTPLITIIYILKNYIKKNHFSKNGLRLEHVQTLDDDYINNTIDLSDYMLSLINDIVDYSVINSEFEFKCEYDSFDLHDLLLFAYRVLKILINCRGLKDFIHPILEINDNVPKNFCSDEKRVKQILLNLITNSIKFTRRGYIKISAISTLESNLLIAIEDTGIGIQNKDIPKLFKDHSKLWDKTSAEMNKIGSGLGLSICKKIVEKIGKCIDVESVPNKKTRFYFILENKTIMKKSFSINRSIESNLAQFKKSIMNVTTKSVKEAKYGKQNPRRPKSFNTHVQLSRIHNTTQNESHVNAPKRLYSDYGETNIKNENNNTSNTHLNTSSDNINNTSNLQQKTQDDSNFNIQKKFYNFNENYELINSNKFIKLNTNDIHHKADLLNVNFKNRNVQTLNLSVENFAFGENNNSNNKNNNIFNKSQNKYLNANDYTNPNMNNNLEGTYNCLEINGSDVDWEHEDATKRFSQDNGSFPFTYKMITKRSLNSSGSLVNIPLSKGRHANISNIHFNINSNSAIGFNKNERNIPHKKDIANFTTSKINTEFDKNFLKLIKPIKKFYNMKNKNIILVVDDNKFLRKSLKNNIRQIFNNTSVEVIGCSDGIETLYLAMIDQMTKNKIKLIISDENMVYMNGTETNMILSNFHMEGKMSFIPFALCSAARSNDEHMITNKISYIINKPPTKSELKSVFMTIGLI